MALPLKTAQKFQSWQAAVLAVCVALIGGFIIFRSFAATAPEPPQSLILQVSSLAPTTTPAQLKVWLETIRTKHRDTSKPAYIDSIVIQDIAGQDGKLLTDYLDVLSPYLPGSATPAFSKAYLGTVDLTWTGAGSKYIEGIEDTTFRDKNISLSRTAAQDFKTRYPNISADWYITYEANLAGFWDTKIETAYVTYLNGLSASLSTVAPNKVFMWSPAFWTPLRNEPSWALPDLKTNLNDLFTKLSPSPILNLQDFVGQSNGESTKEDAVAWVTYLKTNLTTQPRSIQMNVEQFKQSAGGAMSVGDSAELSQRENYYVAQGVPLGASWEMRYWYKRLYETTPTPTPSTMPSLTITPPPSVSPVPSTPIPPTVSPVPQTPVSNPSSKTKT